MYKIGKRGSNTYILNLRDNECAIFDTFGDFKGFINPKTAIIECKNILTDIDILSIVGNSEEKSCGVYFNGNVFNVPERYINVYTKIKNIAPKFDFMTYTLNNREENYSQIILILKKNYWSIEIVKSILSK